MNMGMGGVAGRTAAVGMALLAGAVLTACEENITDVDRSDQLIVAGVSYRVTELAIAESFPVQVAVTVEVSNTSGTQQTVVFPDGCIVLMRAYDADDNLVWDFGRDVGCTTALVPVDLAPGESQTFQVGLVGGDTILGDDLPDGQYMITVYLRPGGQEIELEAGLVDLAIPRN